MANKVITGMGVFGAGYPNVAALEYRLRSGISSIRRHQKFHECTFPSAQIGAVLSDNDIADLAFNGFNTKQLMLIQYALKRYGLVFVSAACAMSQAWQQAGLAQKAYTADEIAIIVVGQSWHLKEQYQSFIKFMKTPAYVRPSYLQQFIDTTLMSFLSELFDIQGGGFDINAATASGNLGIIQATKTLDQQIKCCIVVGAMADLSAMEMQAFYNSGVLGGAGYCEQPENACRPFDTARNGFLYGEGCGCLVIENESDAQARQHPFLAHIIGATNCLDGNTATNPSMCGEVKVMEKLLAQADYPQIDYINAHGTATLVGDEIESQAIAHVFQNKPYVNSTKAFTGHTLWAAGLIECIACIIQLQGAFLHGNINLENPIDVELNLVGKKAINQVVHNALSLSFGFGGINSAVLLGRPVAS